jgi:hypothetical protein
MMRSLFSNTETKEILSSAMVQPAKLIWLLRFYDKRVTLLHIQAENASKIYQD